MASLRSRKRTNGDEYFAVLYRLNGKQTSTSFEDFASASAFCNLATKFGAENALRTLQVDAAVSTLTVESWLTRHIDHLTGVDPNTEARYRAYVRRDIAPLLGDLPLTALSSDHISLWIKGMRQPNAKGKASSQKTLLNKHGFIAGALNTAVAAGHISSNPCDATKWPEVMEREMVCLTREQVAHLISNTTEYWRPMVKFLVVSGARWGEVAALRPGDVDRETGTVRIARSWKHGVGGYTLGAPKTKMSRRTINVPLALLEELDFSNDYLFVNRDGGPVRAHGFHRRVWAPAVERSWPSTDENGKPKTPELRPRIHDLRHSCASLMIHAAVPLPVIQVHLGHESIQTTIAVYGHIDRKSMQVAADAMLQVV